MFLIPLPVWSQNEFIIPEHMYIAINDFTNLEAKKQSINNCICSEK